MLKTATLTPMPSASVSTATAVKPGFFSSWRKANLRSFMAVERCALKVAGVAGSLSFGGGGRRPECCCFAIVGDSPNSRPVLLGIGIDVLQHIYVLAVQRDAARCPRLFRSQDGGNV